AVPGGPGNGGPGLLHGGRHGGSLDHHVAGHLAAAVPDGGRGDVSLLQLSLAVAPRQDAGPGPAAPVASPDLVVAAFHPGTEAQRGLVATAPDVRQALAAPGLVGGVHVDDAALEIQDLDGVVAVLEGLGQAAAFQLRLQAPGDVPHDGHQAGDPAPAVEDGGD